MARPKDINIRKNRIKSIILTFKAAWILKELKKIRPNFELSSYVSEHIIRDFEIDPKSFLKFELGKINIKLDELEAKRDIVVNNIIEIKKHEGENEI